LWIFKRNIRCVLSTKFKEFFIWEFNNLNLVPLKKLILFHRKSLIFIFKMRKFSIIWVQIFYHYIMLRPILEVEWVYLYESNISYECLSMGWARTCNPTRNRRNRWHREALGQVKSWVNNCKKRAKNGCIRAGAGL
jgi:hypothetical protein